jgi:hypothetical protein
MTTTTLDDVTARKKRPEPSAEQRAAEELVRRAREQGLSLTGPDGLLKQLTKTVLETALNEELTEHLGHEKHGPATGEAGNIRNGTRAKTVLTEATGQVQIDVPRDRAGTFEPQIVRKRQRRLTGVDEIVLSLYAKGLTTGEISAHFAEIYGASVSKETISRITDKVLEEMQSWQNRPLDQTWFLPVVANLGCPWMVPSSHELGGGSILEAEPGPVVEFGGDAVQLVARVAGQVGAFGQVLAQQAVGVLVGAALPG